MQTHHTRWMMILALATAMLCAASGAFAEDDARDAWPMYIEYGDRTPPDGELKLVDELNGMRQVWKFQRHMGVGKGLYPGNLRQARSMGLEPFQGGASSPIIADGVVFVSYYKPNGKHPAKREGWRTMDSPEKLALLPDWFFSVTADDILVAIDAETGKLLWERVEKDKGLNRLSHKRSHWGVSPAAAEGVVYHLGSMGRLYATRIADGKALWDVSTDPRLEKLREEHIKAKKLVWDSADRSSLIIAEDVVIVPRGRLYAYNRKTGEKVWQTEENVESDYGTPTLWRHDGRTYVVANSRSGALRLIDPKNGKILWTYDKLGPFLGTLSVTGDLVVLNAGTKKGGEDHGLFGVYELSLKGPRQLWTLPDEAKYWHRWEKDSGPRHKVQVRGDLAYIPLSLKRPPKGMPGLRLIVADAKTGEIHTETPFAANRSNARPIIMEDRILMIHDDAHSDPVTASWWEAGKYARQLNKNTALPHVSITAYCTPIVQPYKDGKLYFRAMDGLVCYDFRKPKKGTSNTLYLTLPGELVGPRGDLDISLYTDKGTIARGGVRGSAFVHDVDVSQLKWNGRKLTGKLGVNLPRTRKTEFYSVDASAGKDGELSGTVALSEKALDKPVELNGAVHTMKHQSAWQPSCDYVLLLEGAALNRDRNPGRLLLFVTTKDGKVAKLSAWADQTTKTRPVVYPQKLELNGETLSGELHVRYRADEWTEPLAADDGITAAATYTFKAKLAKGDNKNVGTYTGTYGVDFEKDVTFEGRFED